MTDGSILTPISLIEEIHLVQLVDDFIELIDTSRGSGDPAIERLTPNPYPEDADSAADFAESTREDLLDRRLADARRVRSALGDPGTSAEPLDDDSLTTKDFLVKADDLDSWLRTLNAIRLVIATRLGITSDGPTGARNGDDQAPAVYDWLGYRLELLIHAADQRS